MTAFMDVLVVVGMFALRIGVPLLVVFGLAYLLKRLDRRWEAEARQQAAEQQSAVQPTAQPRPARRPGVGMDVPGKQLPFDPSRPIPLMAAGQKHCWDVKGCSESQREKCVAAAAPDSPCWEMRLRAEGQLPEACFDCQVFENYPSM